MVASLRAKRRNKIPTGGNLTYIKIYFSLIDCAEVVFGIATWFCLVVDYE